MPHYLLGTHATHTAGTLLHSPSSRPSSGYKPLWPAPPDATNLPQIAPTPLPPAPRSRRSPPALERAAQGLVIAFTVLLATAAYYLGVGDANTVNKLAQWATTRSRPRRRGNSPQALSFLKRVNIIPWMSSR
ncbi:MAG: hypothetical protein ACO2PN_23095 [Pyrobaculum sp.]